MESTLSTIPPPANDRDSPRRDGPGPEGAAAAEDEATAGEETETLPRRDNNVDKLSEEDEEGGADEDMRKAETASKFF